MKLSPQDTIVLGIGFIVFILLFSLILDILETEIAIRRLKK